MKLVFAPQARRDLLEIWCFIADDSVENADGWRGQIEEKCRLIAQSPPIGRRRDELGEGLLGLPLGNYVIFYEVVAIAVRILHVVHGARDLPELFP